METQTAITPAVAASNPQTGITSPASLVSGSKSTPEQRAKWRAKYQARKARLSGQVPVAPVLSPVPSPAGESSAPGQESISPPAIPWDSGTLKPLFDELIPALEKADVEHLCKKAASVSPDLVPIVRADAPWNASAKATIQTTAPAVTAKWLNAAGVSAEHAGEVLLGVAVLSIVTSRSMLLGKLEEMAKKREQPKQENAPI